MKTSSLNPLLQNMSDNASNTVHVFHSANGLVKGNEIGRALNCGLSSLMQDEDFDATLIRRWQVGLSRNIPYIFRITDKRPAPNAEDYAQEFILPWCESFIPGFDPVEWVSREVKIRKNILDLLVLKGPHPGDDRASTHSPVKVDDPRRWMIIHKKTYKYCVFDRRYGKEYAIDRSFVYAAGPYDILKTLRGEMKKAL